MENRCSQCKAKVPQSGRCPICDLRALLPGENDLLGLIPESWDVPDPVCFVGDYLLLVKVGSGAMGEVWKARNVRTHRTAALKILKSGITPARFEQEILTLGMLDHPRIVKVHQKGIDRGRRWFAMDYIDGSNLAELCKGHPMAPREAAGLLEGVAEALAYAHGRSVLHRDLKPGNVLIDSFGNALLADFGVAKQTQVDSSLTETGQQIGTPAYMAPEQVDPQCEHASVRTDVYGLGATLYHLLTGVPPFRAESLPQLLSLVLYQDPASPRILNGSVDSDLETICLKCLRKNPGDRYDSAAEVGAELRRWLDHKPIRARPLSPRERMVKWVRRRPAVAGSLALACLVGLLGFSGILWQWHRAEQQRAAAITANLQKTIERSGDLLNAGLGFEAIDLLARSLRENREDLAVAQRLWAALLQRPLPRLLPSLSTGSGWREAEFSASGLLVIRDYLGNTAWAEPHAPASLIRLGKADRFSALPRFSVDGSWLAAAASQGSKIITLDARTGAELNAFESGSSPRRLELSPDGKHCLILGFGSITLFENPPNLREVWTRSISNVSHAFFLRHDPSLLLGTDKEILWVPTALESRKPLSIPVVPPLLELHLSPDEKEIMVWDSAGMKIRRLDGTLVQTLPALTTRPLAVGFSATGERVCVASRNPSLQIISRSTAEIVGSIPAHRREISSARLHPSGLWITTGSDDGTVRVWSTHDGQPLCEYIPIGAPVRDAILSPNGLTLCALTMDGDIQLWAIPRRPQMLHPLPAAVPARGIHVTSDAQFGLVAPIGDGEIIQYSIETGAVFEGRLPAHVAGELRFAKGNRQAGVPLTNGGLWVFIPPDVNAGFEIPGPFNSPVFSSQGDRVAGHTDRGLSIWSIPRREEERQTSDIRNYSWSTFSPDGAWFIAWVSNQVFRLEVSKGALGQFPHSWRGEQTVADVSSNGLFLASAHFRQVHLLDFETGHNSTLTNAAPITVLAFSPDTTLLAVGDQQGTIKLWSVPAFKATGVPMRHLKAVNAVDFTRDGRLVLSSSADQTVRLWDGRSGLAMTTPEVSVEVEGARFSADDKWILSSTGVRWEFPKYSGESSEIILAAAQRELSVEEPADRMPSTSFSRWLEQARTTGDSVTISPGSTLTWKVIRDRKLAALPEDEATLREIAQSSPLWNEAIRKLSTLRQVSSRPQP